MTIPSFKNPPCLRHFFKGHKWWCRACDREAESQFREVAVAYWTLQDESAAARDSS